MRDLNDIEKRVLEALFDLNDHNPDWVYTYSRIRDEMNYKVNHLNEVPISYIRKAMKKLRKELLVRYTQCFGEDDNLVYGSGHQITSRGENLVKELNSEPRP